MLGFTRLLILIIAFDFSIVVFAFKFSPYQPQKRIKRYNIKEN